MSWKSLERLSNAYLKKPSAETASALDRSMRRSNAFLEALTVHYIRKHNGMENSSVVFKYSEDGQFPPWACLYDPEQQVFQLNPVGVLEFSRHCVQAKELLDAHGGRENFSVYRLNAFLAELRKLPTRFLPLLLLFQEKARILAITHSDKRRAGGAEPPAAPEEEDAYLRLLWAFKELEEVIRNLYGMHLRTECQISWFEPQWILNNTSR